ncbi:MAG: DUF5056 domain-containing protein [Gammaproteobacteria bacterium]|nr:DUF5056 domain-containing protein [Gammaproteobacteria bacterium]
MNHSDDNEIEALLRTQFDGAAPDDGFSDRVMQQLPPRRRHAAWPLLAGILAGTGACWFSLSSTPLLQVGWQNWINGELPASTITLMSVIAGMSLLALWWATMEAEDQ